MRVHNFSAGPSTLPVEALEEAKEEFVDYHGAGMSLVEMSHRGPEYEAVHDDAMTLARQVFEAPDDFEVLLLQGGATLQFAMVPMNLLGRGASGGYVLSGAWAVKALDDGGHHGEVYAAWDGEPSGYTRMPEPREVEVRPGTRYLHVTSNETIGGIQVHEWPDSGVPLVVDMSSDVMSRRVPWGRFDLVYAGAQKNLGPAGSTLVFVRRSVLETTRRDLAAYLRYDVHAGARSLYNTPPVFAIWVMGKTLRWVRDRGGLAAMEQSAQAKAGLLYGAIDTSDGFYRSPVEEASRSLMNVVFRLPSDELETEFLTLAEDEGLVNLRGHRSVGGVRASIYNAMPMAGVEALAAFMAEFRADRA